MLYQLKNGKTIYISIDEFLNMSKEEEQFLLMYGYGEYMNNPFSGSILNSKKLREEIEDLDYEEDDPNYDLGLGSIDDGLDFPDEFLDDGLCS